MVSLQLAWCLILWAKCRKFADSWIEVRPDSSHEISRPQRERERERERCFLIIQNKIECKFPKESSSKPRTRQKQTDNLADASWVLPEGSVHNVWLTDKLTAVGSVSGFFPSLQPKNKNNKNQTLSKQIVITNTMPSDLLELNRVQTWNWYLFAAVAKETNKQEWQEWAGEKT